MCEANSACPLNLNVNRQPFTIRLLSDPGKTVHGPPPPERHNAGDERRRKLSQGPARLSMPFIEPGQILERRLRM